VGLPVIADLLPEPPDLVVVGELHAYAGDPWQPPLGAPISGSQLCNDYYSGCYLYGSPYKYQDYPATLMFKIHDGYSYDILKIAVSAWSSASLAANGLYTEKNDPGIPVSDINLGARADTFGYNHYTCLSFKVSATVTDYAFDDPTKALSVWWPTANNGHDNCGIE
jgi:hypothetical protein